MLKTITVRVVYSQCFEIEVDKSLGIDKIREQVYAKADHYQEQSPAEPRIVEAIGMAELEE